MKKKLVAAAVLLLLLAVLTGPCPAEEMAEHVPATPTDLMEPAEPEEPAEPQEAETPDGPAESGEPQELQEPDGPGEPQEPAGPEDPAEPDEPVCAHEHVSTVIYFFDSPSYTSLSAASHRVTGPGVVAEVCRDCGAILAENTVDNAEEIRPHSMKKGVCALCGYRQQTETSQDRRDAAGERTLAAQSDGSGLLFLTLTEQDLAALENAKVKTLLVRGERGKAVVAVDVREIRREVGRESASFSIEMAERPDGSLFASLSLSNAPGRKEELDVEGVTLRFYDKREPAPRIALDPTDGAGLAETEGVWYEDGYWAVPYIQEGDYLLLK